MWIAKEKGQLQRESVPTYLSAEPLVLKTHPEDLQEKLYRLELQMCPGSRTATLHGLWPLWNDELCAEGPPFIEGVSQIRDLLPELVSMWPSCQPHAREFGWRDSRVTSLLERGTTSKVTTLEQGIQAYQWFWRYEYNKHGKCAVEELFRFVPEKRYTEGVHAYFEKSLELAKKFAPRCQERLTRRNTCHFCLKADDFSETACPGFSGPHRMKRQRNSLPAQDKAAARVQAAWRGFLARKLALEAKGAPAEAEAAKARAKARPRVEARARRKMAAKIQAAMRKRWAARARAIAQAEEKDAEENDGEDDSNISI